MSEDNTTPHTFQSVGRTIFIDPRNISIEEAVKEFNEGNHLFAFVRLDLSEPSIPEAIQYAVQLRDSIVRRGFTDPVMIGPVSPEINQQYEKDFREGGFTPIDIPVDEFMKDLAQREKLLALKISEKAR